MLRRVKKFNRAFRAAAKVGGILATDRFSTDDGDAVREDLLWREILPIIPPKGEPS